MHEYSSGSDRYYSDDGNVTTDFIHFGHAPTN
jgi:hypothetical protein